MTFNDATFFTYVRNAPFGKGLTQQQVDGLNVILNYWKTNLPDMDKRWLAYILATTFHETAGTMQPISERGGDAYFRRMYDINGQRPQVARNLGNLTPGDGVRYHGRGFVQITGRTNYAKYGLADRPDDALKPEVAVHILFDGMIRGVFTGKKLSDYFDANTDDPVNARRIVNATDKANLIAGYHKNFLDAIKKAQEPVTPPEVTKETATPDTAPVAATPTGGGIALAGVGSAGLAAAPAVIGAINSPWAFGAFAIAAVILVIGFIMIYRDKKKTIYEKGA